MLSRRSGFRFAKAHVLCIAMASMACGRPATEAECQLIVDRIIEVELKAEGTNDPALITKKKEELRATFTNELKECTGRRVTNGMLACVRAATTADEINQCIR